MPGKAERNRKLYPELPAALAGSGPRLAEAGRLAARPRQHRPDARRPCGGHRGRLRHYRARRPHRLRARHLFADQPRHRPARPPDRARRIGRGRRHPRGFRAGLPAATSQARLPDVLGAEPDPRHHAGRAPPRHCRHRQAAQCLPGGGQSLRRGDGQRHPAACRNRARAHLPGRRPVEERGGRTLPSACASPTRW